MPYAHIGAVGVLLEAGAPLYAANRDGASPLVLAAPHPAVAALLLAQTARLAAQGDPQAGMAQAAQLQLSARLAAMARTEPEVLNALVQEQDGQVRGLLLTLTLTPTPTPTLTPTLTLTQP